MNSLFKFPRCVRKHGGECGAVARALHHEAKSLSLPAVEKKAFFTTNERKQMSTKTAFKRIALVAVSALGLSLFSVLPQAAAYANNITLGYSSLTVIDTSNTGTASKAGFFYVDVSDDAGDAAALGSGESITATVTGVPTDPAGRTISTGDLTLQAVSMSTAKAATVRGAAAATTQQIPNGTGTLASFASNNEAYSTTLTSGTDNRYWWAVYPTDTKAINAGTYTITVRLISSTAGSAATQFIVAKTLSVKFVSNAEDSGAVITVAKTGEVTTGQALNHVTNQNVTATLRDANGGRVQLAAAASGGSVTAPSLTAQILTSAGAVAETLTSVTDNGTAGTDHIASTTAAQATQQTRSNLLDGVYGVKDDSIGSSASLTTTLQVRLTGTSKVGTLAVPVRAATTIIDNKTDLLLTADGILAADSVTKSNVATTTAYTLPTTTKTATLTINVDDSSNAAVADVDVTTKVTWSGNYASGNVTPASATTTTTKSDASGNVKVTVTNSAPVAGAVATILVTGFAFSSGVNSDPTSGGSRTVTLTWASPAVTTITVADPVASVRVKTGTTNTFSVSVTDQFGQAMAGEQLVPSLSSTSSNYSATTTYASVTTNASGIATWSLTDAVAAAGSDAVTFTSVTDSSKASSAFTLTYVATLPVVATMLSYYDHSFTGTASTAVPASGITAGSSGTGAALIMVTARNISKSLASFEDSSTDDMLAIRIAATTSAGAAATGAAVTLTAPDGGHVLNASNLPASSRTKAVASTTYVDFQILITKPGTLTFKATSGTVSQDILVKVATPVAATGRTISISGATSGTANGAVVPLTVAVKDRYGNGVTGVVVTLGTSGVGSYAGGATTQSFTTDDTGTFTVSATSLVSAGGSATFSASMSSATATESTMVAGVAGGVTVDSTLAAGKSSATHTVTFAAGIDPAVSAAEAATDAAAEAIDAANAATDAANLAAEAADAATVAAEEARDAADAATAAVEELATQVATLMAALKAQITTLANTVAKIAKKVKA